MMKILYYDCFSGISGDMHLGAMLDLGVDEMHLRGTLSLLGMDGEYRLAVGRDSRKGITGTKVDVIVEQGTHPPHRHLGDITDIITGSSLPSHICTKSIETFGILARAEAAVHGTSVDEVHFHEVGATDAIVDIVGAAICVDYMGVDAIYSSPVELGGGFVTCAHGRIPVPAPATVEILRGAPVRFGAVAHETTTPTGAALLAEYVQEYQDRASFAIDGIGYGIGARDTEIPNVLRVYRGTSQGAGDARWDRGDALILETNIDDMNPELYDHVSDLLFSLGARDVYTAPITMKKGRPGTLLSVLCEQSDEPAIVEALFTETTTLGVRSFPISKHMMQRSMRTVHTPYGPVRVKAAYLGKTPIKEKPEYDDCRRCAAEAGVPISRIYQAVRDAVGGGHVP